MTRIYTKTGDRGDTGLFGGSRVKKSSPRLHAYGSLDELNALLGLTLADDELPDLLRNEFTRLQSTLFIAGSDLATPLASSAKIPRITDDETLRLERLIDAHEATLSPLTTFIAPGGTTSAARLHLCRTVCRRAERWLTELTEQEDVNPSMLPFVNRLSDYLFVCARVANRASGRTDVTIDVRKEAEKRNS